MFHCIILKWFDRSKQQTCLVSTTTRWHPCSPRQPQATPCTAHSTTLLPTVCLTTTTDEWQTHWPETYDAVPVFCGAAPLSGQLDLSPCQTEQLVDFPRPGRRESWGQEGRTTSWGLNLCLAGFEIGPSVIFYRQSTDMKDMAESAIMADLADMSDLADMADIATIADMAYG